MKPTVRFADADIPLSVDVVLFDMDGVLVDVSGSYRRAIVMTVAHFSGQAVAPETVQRYKKRGSFNNDWKLTAALLADAGLTVPFADVVQVFQGYYQGSNWDGLIAHEPPLIHTATLAHLAATYPLAIATGRPAVEAQWTLERLGWTKFFPVVVPMEMQGSRGKPDPFPLQKALELLRQPEHDQCQESAVYIGDTGDDMKAARSAGAWAIGVIPPYLGLDKEAHRTHLVEQGAHVVLDDVNLVPQILRKAERKGPS